MTPHLVPYARATLYAEGVSIEYVRAGRGDTVVLLQDSDAAAPPLLDSLARDHRVIVPVVPSGGTFAVALEKLLENLLEGLGVERAGLVATGGFRQPAQEFAARHPGRVASLVLL